MLPPGRYCSPPSDTLTFRARDPLGEQDVPVRAREVAGELVLKVLGDVQARVRLHLDGHVGLRDPEVLRLAREHHLREPVEDPADDGQDHEADHDPLDQRAHALAPPPTSTRGAASASTGASKNSRRSNRNARATITGGNTWIFVL